MTAPDPTLRRIELPERGFALLLPHDWQEQRPDPFNSSAEVARFHGPAIPSGGMRVCLVFRFELSALSQVVLRAGGRLRPGLDAKILARHNQLLLARRGYRHFRVRDAALTGRAAARLDCDRRWPGGGVWAVRQYFVVAGGHAVILSFGTRTPERDEALVDTLAAGFDLIDGAVGAAGASEIRTPANRPERPAPRRTVRVDSKTRRRFAAYWHRARSVVLAAHDEAVSRGRTAIEPEHLLLGISLVPGTAALVVLEDLGVSPAQLRAAVEAALSSTSGGPAVPIHAAADQASTTLRLTKPAEATLALAEEEARAFGRRYVGVGELLLGLVRQPNAGSSDVFAALGLRVDMARASLRRHYEAMPERGPTRSNSDAPR